MKQQGTPGGQTGNKKSEGVLMSSDTKTDQEFIPMVLLMLAMIQ